MATEEFSGKSSIPQFQNYEVLEEIARGGMGIVYRAVQRQPKRMVAIKMLRSDCFATKSQIERFATEAQAAAQLDSESVVPIYEFGNVDGKPFIAMKYIDGQTLDELLNQKNLSWHACANLLVTICDAVSLAHDRGIVHRDIKPSNILVDRVTGRPWITDFGIAKYLENEISGTKAGDVLGTPGYMPPELAFGNSHNSSRSVDVYGLGAVLYRMLTGRPPIDTSGIDLASAIQRIRDHEVVSPRSVNRAIPPSLASICMKCLEREPNDRYDNARELASDLRRFLAGEPVQAKPIGPMRHLHQWARKRPGLAVTWIVLAVFYIYHILCRSFDWYNEPGFDRAAPIIALLAATSAWIWQQLLTRSHGAAFVLYLWVTSDLVLLTILLFWASSANSSLTLLYHVIVAGSVLRCREALVAYTTALALVGYGIHLVYVHIFSTPAQPDFTAYMPTFLTILMIGTIQYFALVKSASSYEALRHQS